MITYTKFAAWKASVNFHGRIIIQITRVSAQALDAGLVRIYITQKIKVALYPIPQHPKRPRTSISKWFNTTLTPPPPSHKNKNISNLYEGTQPSCYLPSDIWICNASASCVNKSQNWSPTCTRVNLATSRSKSVGGFFVFGNHKFKSSWNATHQNY